MTDAIKSSPRHPRGLGLIYKAAAWSLLILCAAAGRAAASRERGTPSGEWRYWGGDTWSARYPPLDQIDGDNFELLEVVWMWRADNVGPKVEFVLRLTPVYSDGRLFTVAGQRRTVASIDPATGETLWTYREPHTFRYERSERFKYGRGVTYGEVDGRGVIYLVTPAFFLHALDAQTGKPLHGFGGAVEVPGFPRTGVVDRLADLGHPYDPYERISPKIGTVTNSHPPMVVNGVVVVASSGPRSRYQTREENVPADILAYGARTGRASVDVPRHPKAWRNWPRDVGKRCGPASATSSWEPSVPGPATGRMKGHRISPAESCPRASEVF